MASLRDGRTAPKTLKGLTELLERIPPGLRHTLTWDQGSEMAGHAELANRCGINIYFADAHCPWQRPTNENGMRLIRRYVGNSPERSRFSDTDPRSIHHPIHTTHPRVPARAPPRPIHAPAPIG